MMRGTAVTGKVRRVPPEVEGHMMLAITGAYTTQFT